MPQRHQTARFRVGTCQTRNPRGMMRELEKERRRKEKENDSKGRNGRENGEEEREGDMLQGLSPQTKNAGYVSECS